MLLGVIQNYNPHMRLLVIDDDKPSLVDNIINKNPIVAQIPPLPQWPPTQLLVPPLLLLEDYFINVNQTIKIQNIC